MNIFVIIGIVILITFVFYYFAFKSAPVGYEDETGFHYGKEKRKK
jgi:hypothetical protein